MILAGICIGVAALLMIFGRMDEAFVVAVLGIVFWFINYRMQLRDITNAADAARFNEGEDVDD